MLRRFFGRGKNPGRKYNSVAEGMVDLYPDCTSLDQAQAYAANLDALNAGEISRDEWFKREQEIEAEYNQEAQ